MVDVDWSDVPSMESHGSGVDLKVTPKGRRSLCHGDGDRCWGLAKLSCYPRDQLREPERVPRTLRRYQSDITSLIS
ncbi:unnamed protein product [Lampetra planeri]